MKTYRREPLFHSTRSTACVVSGVLNFHAINFSSDSTETRTRVHEFDTSSCISLPDVLTNKLYEARGASHALLLARVIHVCNVHSSGMQRFFARNAVTEITARYRVKYCIIDNPGGV